MDRLTYWCDNWHGGGKWFVAIDAEGREDYGPHVDRLAAYEETGLEPGEIEQLKGEVFGLRLDKQELEQYRALGPIDRLRELKQADDEGRCVVLPFKPPRWVYMCSARFPKPAKAHYASAIKVERAPKGDDIGSKLDRILEMLEAKARGGRGERPLHDEEDLDDLIEKLAGEETVAKEKAVTIPAEEMADQLMEPGTRDAAVALLKKVRPAVAAIQNRAERARVVDALLSTIQGPDVMSGIVQAARDSAQKAADTARRTSYETACAEAQAAYAARNPHKAGKEGE